MQNILVKLKFYLCLVLIITTISAKGQDTIGQKKSYSCFIAASGYYSASKNIDIARYYITRSIGGEAGFFLGQKNIISLTYERTQINEYDAKYKNLDFWNINLKRLIPFSKNFATAVGISTGRASGKFINFGVNRQGEPEIEGESKHSFIELGARYTSSKPIFIELRFLQMGYVDKYIEKQFPSGLKAFVINDDEYFPIRLTIGYRI